MLETTGTAPERFFSRFCHLRVPKVLQQTLILYCLLRIIISQCNNLKYVKLPSVYEVVLYLAFIVEAESHSIRYKYIKVLDKLIGWNNRVNSDVRVGVRVT